MEAFDSLTVAQHSKYVKGCKLIKRKEDEVKKLKEQEEQLHQIELLLQKEKEFLLSQYKHTFPDKPPWSTQGNGDDKNTNLDTSPKGYMYSEVYQHLCQIKKQEEQKNVLTGQLYEARARQQHKEISNALCQNKQDAILASEDGKMSALYDWYMMIKNATIVEENPKRGNLLDVSDQLFYHVKYKIKNLQSEETKDHININQARSRSKKNVFDPWRHPWLTRNWREMLSFNTRHRGMCVNVLIVRNASVERVKDSKSTTQAELDEHLPLYSIKSDPYVADVEERGLDYLSERDHPENFVKSVVWKFIDTET